MSKSIKVLLLTLLALCFAFSAAFAADGTPLTINLDAGKAATTAGGNDAVNVLTGKETAALTFSAAGASSETVSATTSAIAITLALQSNHAEKDILTKVEISDAGVLSAKKDTTDVVGKFSFTQGGALVFTPTGGQVTAALTFSAAGESSGTVTAAADAKAITLALPTGHSAKDTLTKVEISDAGILSAKKDTTDVAGKFSVNDDGVLVFTVDAENTFTVSAGQKLSGTYKLTDETDKKYTFTPANDAKIKATIPGTGANATPTEVDLAFNGAALTLTLPETGETTITLIGTFTGSTNVNSTTTSYRFEAATLTGSEDVAAVEAAGFVSSDIKVYADGTLIKTVTASADINSADVYVDLGAKVSFDVVLSSDVLGVSEDGVALASKDNYYTLSKDFAASGDKAVVVITFASGDDGGSFKFTLNVIASGDSSSKTTTTETYLLKVSDITLTPANAVSNTAKLISADTDNYSKTLNLTNLDSTASGDWGSFAEFTASSDYLGGSFSVTVSTDAKLVNVYVMNGTAWDAVDTDELSGKVITPNTIGWYKVVLSADLIASSDKTVSGDAYFAFDFKVTSVDAPKATGDVVVDASNASTDATGGAGGNPVISAGQKIDTKFLSGTAISPSAFASFFSSATTVTMLSETELAAALETLGLDEDDMGDSENGYKALAFGLPSGFTLTANEKFFVLLTTNENGTGTNRLGVGVVSPKLDGSRTMVIVFKLLKNPAHTADFMTFDAGEYFVGATNDTASADTSSSTRAVFVTAGGTFNIKSEEATLLQGQTASGTATPYEGDDDDDDNQETSSHGSSSGCDAGFGALALLAVAGALAARKVRK